MTATEFINLLEAGIKANLEDCCRSGNLVSLPKQADLVIAGDLHGHRRNFERIVSYSDLSNNPQRHIILQEIIHGGPEDDKGGCLSFELLAEAVKLKTDFKDNVHIIMANHDTAFINNSKVMKNGKEMNTAMRQALQRNFADETEAVESAMERFLFSQPLAVRCPNRIWLSHSLPSNRYMDKFDFSIFSRQLKVSDIVRPNSAYLLTWGRKHSQKTLNFFAEKLDVDLFVLGHQVQESGWTSNNDNLVIIDSQHNHGYISHIKLSKSYSIDDFINSLIRLAEIP